MNRVVSCFRLRAHNSPSGNARRLWVVILDLGDKRGGSPNKVFDEGCIGEACLKDDGILTPAEIEFVKRHAPTIEVGAKEYLSWLKWEKHNLDNG